MSRLLPIIVFTLSSAKSSSKPAVSELNGAATLSWQIPARGLGSGVAFNAISPAGSLIFLLTPSEMLIPSVNYKNRIDFNVNYKTRNITFTLRNISSADAGTYRCGNGGTSPDQFISDCGQMLVVLGKPTKPTRPSPSTTPVYTKQVTLTCTSTSTSIPNGHGLTLTYTWDRDGTIVTPDPGTSFTFTISSRDPHNYRCRTDESRGLDSDWSDVYRMEPEYGPYQETLTPLGLTYTVREKQTSVPPISCLANCNPDCTYCWEKNGTNFSNSMVLNLGQTSRSQAGSYRCRAVNDHGGVYTSSVSVTVQYRAIISEFSINSAAGPVSVSEGDTVTLKCQVDSNPPATIRLLNGSQELKRGDNTLSITSTWQTTCRQGGYYSCGASNSVGPVAVRDLNLAVKCSPRPDETFPVKYQSASRLRGSVTLWMSVLSYPVPTFIWSRSNSSSRDLSGSLTVLSDTSVNISLSLASLRREDIGLYTLTISNGFGEDGIFIFELLIQGPPEPPTDVSVTSDWTSMYITWLRGYNGGLTQTFAVEYSLDKTVWTTGGTEAEIENLEYYKTVISNLAPSTQYFVRVRAHNQLGDSPFTEISSVTTGVKNAVSETSRPDNLGTGVGIGFAVTIPVFVVVIVVMYRRMKATEKSKRTSTDLTQTDRAYEDVGPNLSSDRSMYDGLDDITRTQDYSELKLYENSKI